MRGSIIQLCCAFILTFPCAMTGFSNVWPSYAIGILESDKSPLGFKITQTEANMISSIPMLGSLISTSIAGSLAEALGRKKSLILCGLCYMLSWSLILTSRSTIQVMLGRFIIGLSAGSAILIFYITISEITELSLRGSTTSMASLLYNFGLMTSYLQGWFCSYEVIGYTSLTFSLIYVIFISCLKETPPYLLKMGKEKEALKSLKFYRGQSDTTDAILKELSYMKSQGNRDAKDSADAEKPISQQQSEKEQLQNEKNLDDNSTPKNAWMLLFTVPHNRRALINSITFMILTVCMGMIAVQTYASQFFTRAVPTLSSDVCSVLLATVQIGTCITTVAVTDLFPRRTLMISTCGVATACLAILGALMRMPWVPAWVAPLFIMIFCIVYHLGVMNIVFVQLSESYGPQVTSAATAVALSTMHAANFMVLYLFVPIVENLGISGTFFLFASISAITTVLAIFCLKETKRVPLEDIQRMYNDGFMYKRVSSIEK